METWRYIEDAAVAASHGLAADEFLLRAAAQGGPAALRLYTYRPYAALVGRFQNVEAELRLDECRRLGAEINRRLTGGGAVIMGAGQLGLALAVSLKDSGRAASPALLFQRYAAPIIQGLRALGVTAGFRPKNDLEVEGKKIAGLALYLDEEDALLFHASILVDVDIPLMLSLLNLTPEKISDKKIATYEERFTTVRRVARRPLAVEEVRQAIRRTFQQALGVKLEPQPFAPEEAAAIRELEEGRYHDPGWVFQRTPPLDASGAAIYKTRGGLLRVHVALAGQVLKGVLITGDFFGERRALHDLEARLKWSPAAFHNVGQAVREAWAEANSPPVWGLPPAALVDVIMAAVGDAQRAAGTFNKAAAHAEP